MLICLPAEEQEGRLAGDAAAEVERREVQQCRQWLAQGKPGGMTQSE